MEAVLDWLNAGMLVQAIEHECRSLSVSGHCLGHLFLLLLDSMKNGRIALFPIVELRLHRDHHLHKLASLSHSWIWLS